eukprot:12909514-Prorocentrum_lima.AAC.1
MAWRRRALIGDEQKFGAADISFAHGKETYQCGIAMIHGAKQEISDGWGPSDPVYLLAYALDR